MATTNKVLGQVDATGSGESTLYTVPALTSAVGSSLVVCNRAATAATFTVAVSVAGGVTADKDYLYYAMPIDGNDTFIATIGMTLATTDKVKVNGSTTNITFTLFGQEIT
jgi:hypothetical protein